jgi:hypothetical protein
MQPDGVSGGQEEVREKEKMQMAATHLGPFQVRFKLEVTRAAP